MLVISTVDGSRESPTIGKVRPGVLSSLCNTCKDSLFFPWLLWKLVDLIFPHALHLLSELLEHLGLLLSDLVSDDRKRNCHVEKSLHDISLEPNHVLDCCLDDGFQDFVKDGDH
jgi:hypothetical protein